MIDQPDKNPRGLRVIKTARTLKKINEAAKEGFRPFLKPVEPGEEIHDMVAVFQHRETGEIVLSRDCRGGEGPEYECVIPYRNYYPYHFPAPFAAYLIPSDLQTGETVWLEDVIEDMVAVWGNQGYQPRLKWSEASWDGENFTILFNPEEDAPRWIG